MSKVVKFGGSSLASAEQFKKVGNIIRADKERKYVVPSAPGKRFSNDTKVTDMLYACYDLADQGKSFKAELDAIKARYQELEEIRQNTEELEELRKLIYDRKHEFGRHSGSDQRLMCIT
jgi:aspartate kinase